MLACLLLYYKEQAYGVLVLPLPPRPDPGSDAYLHVLIRVDAHVVDVSLLGMIVLIAMARLIDRSNSSLSQ